MDMIETVGIPAMATSIPPWAYAYGKPLKEPWWAEPSGWAGLPRTAPSWLEWNVIFD